MQQEESSLEQHKFHSKTAAPTPTASGQTLRMCALPNQQCQPQLLDNAVVEHVSTIAALEIHSFFRGVGLFPCLALSQSVEAPEACVSHSFGSRGLRHWKVGM